MADESFVQIFRTNKTTDSFGSWVLRGNGSSIVVRDADVLARMELDTHWVGKPFMLRPYRRRSELHVVMAPHGYHATKVLTTAQTMFAYRAHEARTVLRVGRDVVVLVEPTLGARFRINGDTFRHENMRLGGSLKRLIVAES